MQSAIKIASTALNDSQAYDNFIEALPEIIKGVWGGADNIRSLHIKTADSTSLPVYEANVDTQESDNEEDEDYDSLDELL